MSRRALLDEEAYAILDTCDPSTDRTLVVWATGVVAVKHAIELAVIPADPRLFTKTAGWCGGGHRGVDTDSRGARVWDWADKDDPSRAGYAQVAVVPRVKWTEIAALVTLERVGEELYEQIRTAMAIRRERAQTYGPQTVQDWYGSAEHMQRQQLWHDIEEECYELAARVWQACRPARPAQEPQQLTLFDPAAWS